MVSNLTILEAIKQASIHDKAYVDQVAAELGRRITELAEAGIDDETINQIIQDYLAAHPIVDTNTTYTLSMDGDYLVLTPSTGSAQRVQIPRNEGGGYAPPAGGIPKTDLAQSVQQSLNKADTALQTVPGADEIAYDNGSVADALSAQSAENVKLINALDAIGNLVSFVSADAGAQFDAIIAGLRGGEIPDIPPVDNPVVSSAFTMSTSGIITLNGDETTMTLNTSGQLSVA